jgi:hypothetical protein
VKWLELSIGGQRWKVYLVGPKSKHLMGPEGTRVGTCDYEHCRIYISKSVGEDAREDALLHELLHAALYVSGAEAAYGGDAVKDEQIVGALTPCLHRVLKDLGFRFPRGVWQ